MNQHLKKPVNVIATIAAITLISLLSSCTYNPFYPNNHTTGAATGVLVGAGVGGGTAALLGASKPVIGLAAIFGGAVGYYATTLRYDSAGIIHGGGKVYTSGKYVGIYLPNDVLFEPNTADLLPQATPILDSAVAVLKRYPDNSIVISGNSSSFYNGCYEQRLSEKRAKAVSAYLWNAGINTFKTPSNDMRRLTYVGYGDHFPISEVYSNEGIRSNSRIQIVSFPATDTLVKKNCNGGMGNMGAMDDDPYHYDPNASITVTDSGQLTGINP